MIVFTVHEPPNAPADRIDRGEKLEFVRDGFTALAAALPPVWMVMNRLWVALLIYLIGVTAVDVALSALGLKGPMIVLITLAANVLIGFEADRVKRWSLRRGGWAEIGTVAGRNRAECERRFFDGWLTQQPIIRRASAAAGADGLLGVSAIQPTPDLIARQTAAGMLRRLWRRLRRSSEA